MRVVGVDQSYTGFGFCVDGESKKKGFPISRFPSDLVRLVAVRDWFSQWLSLQSGFEIDLVAMEGYANAAKFGREAAGELGSVVKLAVLDVLGQEPLIVPPTSLKKFVTGKGNAKKNEMLLGVYKQWGESFADDNQADAFALEKFGEAYLDIEAEVTVNHYPKYQADAVEAVRKAK